MKSDGQINKLKRQIDDLFNLSTNVQQDDPTKLYEKHILEIIQEVQVGVNKCKVDFKILNKQEDKVDKLKSQINQKDTLNLSLTKKLEELEMESFKSYQVINNELSKEKLRNQETVYNLSINNSQIIQELQEELIKKKYKIIYYEAKVDTLKKLKSDLELEISDEKGVIEQQQNLIKQQNLENDQLIMGIKAFQDAIQIQNRLDLT